MLGFNNFVALINRINRMYLRSLCLQLANISG